MSNPFQHPVPIDRGSRITRVASVLVMAVALAGLLGVDGAAAAEEQAPTESSADQKDAKKKEDGLAVKDLPKPVPETMDALQRFGNRVGKELSDVFGKLGRAASDAVKESSSEEKQKTQ